MEFVDTANFTVTIHSTNSTGEHLVGKISTNLFGNSQLQKQILANHQYYLGPLEVSKRKGGVTNRVITNIPHAFKDSVSYYSDEITFSLPLRCTYLQATTKLVEILYPVFKRLKFSPVDYVIDSTIHKLARYLTDAVNVSYYDTLQEPLSLQLH